MVKAMVDGGGSTSAIQIDPDELTHIAKELMAIANEFDTVAKPAINQLKSNQYITEGKAKKAMEAVPEANERVLELQDHYTQASSLVFDTLQSMIEADREIGEKIIAALNIGGTGE